jgi:hypothetical protein
MAVAIATRGGGFRTRRLSAIPAPGISESELLITETSEAGSRAAHGMTNVIVPRDGMRHGASAERPSRRYARFSHFAMRPLRVDHMSAGSLRIIMGEDGAQGSAFPIVRDGGRTASTPSIAMSCAVVVIDRPSVVDSSASGLRDAWNPHRGQSTPPGKRHARRRHRSHRLRHPRCMLGIR